MVLRAVRQVTVVRLPVGPDASIPKWSAELAEAFGDGPSIDRSVEYLFVRSMS